jgi:glucose-1-phosphate cytidylyltransferase
VRDYLGDQLFCLTYDDAVADIDIGKLLASHAKHDRLATVTAVTPPGRFGWLGLPSDRAVQGFRENPHGDGGWINGGFFVVIAHPGSSPCPSAMRAVR